MEANGEPKQSPDPEEAGVIVHGQARPDNAFERFLSPIITWLAIALAVFHLYTGFAGAYGALIQRSIHLSPILVLTYLLYPTATKDRFYIFGRLLDTLFIIGSVSIGLYIIDQYHVLTFRDGNPNLSDMLLGILAIILVLEATRRVIGWTLPLVAVAFVIYAYWGPNMPGVFGHRGYDWGRILQHTYTSTEGIYGLPIGVSATFVILFIIFGAILQETGAGRFFIDLAFALFGRVRGGPAKVAVVGSTLFGTISGSATANVVGTGTFTIPMMKRLGYQPTFAAAVEAVASTGGQFMPPIMGAAVFVMIEMIHVTYREIIVMALLPAILYYIAVFIAVDLEAVRLGLRGMDRSELPKATRLLADGWPFLAPPVILVFMLMYMYWSPTKAGFWAIVSTVAVSSLKASSRLTPRQILGALRAGTMATLQVALACACAGVVVSVFTLTGLGAKVSFALLELANEALLPMLVIGMVTSILLGMGMPTTPAYIILAVLIAPSLVKAGVPQISAHLFVFYSGIISAITPPVALAAYAGAAIAKAPPLRTGFLAMRIGLAAFIVPFMFVYSPGLVFHGSPWEVVYSIGTSLLGILAITYGVQGRMLRELYIVERMILVVSGLLFIPYSISANGIGLFLFLALVAWQRWRSVDVSLRIRHGAGAEEVTSSYPSREEQR